MATLAAVALKLASLGQRSVNTLSFTDKFLKRDRQWMG